MKKLILALVIFSLVCHPAHGRIRRCGVSCAPVAVAAPVTVAAPPTTIVNNLVGIPVPVQYSEPIAVQGATQYGYDQFAQAYTSNVDMGLLYHQAARLTDQAQQLAGQAATDFSALVQSEGYNRTEVAKILAQGQAASAALAAVNGGQTQNFQRTFTFKVTQDASGELHIEKNDGKDFSLVSPLVGAKGSHTFDSVLDNRCVKCHNATTANGGLNLDTDVTNETLKKIWSRVTSSNPQQLMPKSADGSPDPLSPAEVGAVWETVKSAVLGK